MTTPAIPSGVKIGENTKHTFVVGQQVSSRALGIASGTVVRVSKRISPSGAEVHSLAVAYEDGGVAHTGADRWSPLA